MRKEIIDLQKEMRKHGISMYLIPTADEHQSEYISDYYKFRTFLSGFTGSAGTLLVTLDECMLWTDGRYFVQAANELENSGIILMKSGEKDVPTILEYISVNIKENEILGMDFSLTGLAPGREYEHCVKEKGAKIMDISFVKQIWDERPNLEFHRIYGLDISYAGVCIEDKVRQIRENMNKKNASAHIVSSLDDIAWIFNLRGSDIPYNPVFYSYAVITMDGVMLYLDKDSLDEELFDKLEKDGVTVNEYNLFYDSVKECLKGESILLNDQKSSYKLYCLLKDNNTFLWAENPSTDLKAVKNDIECENLRLAHMTDGLVMIKFIYWIKRQMLKRCTITECDAADYLDDLRLKAAGCKDLSFDTIAAYGANAAMCHYSPDREHPVEIRPKGFFLVDSGGQYVTGTTDVTRTIAVGPLSAQQKRHYTLVLKGHIRLAMARFPRGVCGANLDVLARGPLWQACLDYNHGTGHGVGYFLNVHEGPNSIHWNLHRKSRVFTSLLPGMLTSNEPGLYLEGEYGIRLENLVLTRPVLHEGTRTYDAKMVSDCAIRRYEDERFLEFETVTKVPFERAAVIKELLTEEELNWLNQYHRSIYELYRSQLTAEERIWLANATSPL